MLLRLLGTIFFLSLSAQAAEWPKPNAANCDFYYQLETKLKCKTQDENYLSDYAPFYCEKFLKESHEWSRPLKGWAQKTSNCLQEKLYEHQNNTQFNCKTLEEEAFRIHSKCYNEADLCQLKISEIYKIFQVIKLKDFFKEFKYSDGGMTRLMTSCLKNHLF